MWDFEGLWRERRGRRKQNVRLSVVFQSSIIRCGGGREEGELGESPWEFKIKFCIEGRKRRRKDI